MAESIKDKVAIIGMGTSQFGELFDQSEEDLMIDATYEAIDDAGIDIKDIEAAWVGSVCGSTGVYLSRPLKLQYIPVTRLENVCATGAEAVRAAAFALISKAYDLVLSVGVEKLKDAGYGGLPNAGGGSERMHPVYGIGVGPPARYALAATRYFHRYGLTREEGKRTLAKISVKSHYNGSRNPRAHLRRVVTEEQVISAPMIAWPLGLFDCCGVTDGAAATIMCRAEDVKRFKPNGDYVTIKGIGISAGPGMGKIRTDYDYTHWEETERASRQAYDQAGIKDPRKELDLVELHDCFSIAELIAIESMGLCDKGKCREDIEAGTFTQEGEIPANLSGGLKSFGHPAGASGQREIYEIYTQVLGRAEDSSRQLKNVNIGMAHNQGGNPGTFVCSCTIVGRP